MEVLRHKASWIKQTPPFWRGMRYVWSLTTTPIFNALARVSFFFFVNGHFDFMISKKALLIVSGIITAVLVLLDRTGTDTLCRWIQQDTVCMGILYSTIMNFFPIIPLFLFSLITYKMRDEVYHAWLRFAYVWIPLSMLAIFVAPEYSYDWMFPVVKGTVAFFSSLLFLIISLILIAYRALRSAPTK